MVKKRLTDSQQILNFDLDELLLQKCVVEMVKWKF